MTHTITVRHLRHFRYVASTLNLHRAADDIPTDVTSLSRTIKQLEDRLGVKLFVREPHGLRLTPAGEALKAHSDDLVGNFEHVVRTVKETYAGMHLPLRVGIADGLAQPQMSQRLGQWAQAEPGIGLEMIEVSAAGITAGLRREELDVGLSFGVPMDRGIVQEAIWSYPVVVLVPTGNALAAEPGLTLKRVAAQPLVVCHPHHKPGVHRQVAALIRRYNKNPKIVDQAQSLGGFIARIGMGCGIGLADAGHMLTVNRPDIVSIPLLDDTAALTTYVVYRRSRKGMAPALQRFIAHMKVPA